uniref:Tripartite motif containing 58 n=1 Tax=Strigops habroptila TaxID=2489341 RepID=A0A672U5S6_STRHB
MAAQSPADTLRSETSCSICLSYFQDPVSIPCGHNFCRGCISRCWEGLEAPFSCPQCRQPAPQRSFRPSRELANIALIARTMSPGGSAGRGGGGGGGWETLCGQHQEALKLFCTEDLEPICVVCDRSRAHRGHSVVPIEEAAQKYKVKAPQIHGFQAWKVVPSGSPRLDSFTFANGEKAKSPFSSLFRKRLVGEFHQLQRFLREQERFVLAELAQLERAVAGAHKDAAAKVSEEMSHLDTLLWEMEGTFQQPPSRFLQVGTGASHPIHPYGALLCQGTERGWGLGWSNVTLDPSTAHPNLRISEDHKEARGHLRQRDVQDTPGRFDYEPCVLGQPGFTSGRHFWEVAVGQGGVWALGVARASIPRKGPLSLTPKEGVWALEAFHSLTSPRASPRPSPLPSRIRVSLDYEGGRVAFFSADDEVPILVYTRASFNGERLLPWFKMGMGARLRDITQASPSEEQPLSGQMGRWGHQQRAVKKKDEAIQGDGGSASEGGES